MSRHHVVGRREPRRDVRLAALTHPDDVVAVHERVLAGSSAQGRHLEVVSGQRVHVIEAGGGRRSYFSMGAAPQRCCFSRCSSV